MFQTKNGSNLVALLGFPRQGPAELGSWILRGLPPPPQPAPGCGFFLAAAVSDPELTPNEPGTALERIPNGPRTDPERPRNLEQNDAKHILIKPII